MATVTYVKEARRGLNAHSVSDLKLPFSRGNSVSWSESLDIDNWGILMS